MIERPTVFVIGAGASVPFKLPTGNRLRDQIVSSPESVASVIRASGDSWGDPGHDCTELSKLLRDSASQSIDQFLEDRPDFDTIGRVAISTAIYPLEQAAQDSVSPNENWIALLLNCMQSDPKDFINNRCKFIIFNYDRILEFSIKNMLISRHRVPENHADRIVGQLDIIHPYGKLSRSDGFRKISGYGLDHLDEITAQRRNDQIYYAAEGIKTMSATRSEPEVKQSFNTAKQWIESAERVYFLGFGFDPMNCERLGINGEKWLSSGQYEFIGGTLVGMRDNELERLCRQLGFSRFEKSDRRYFRHKSGKTFHCGLPQEGCDIFLRDWPPN